MHKGVLIKTQEMPPRILKLVESTLQSAASLVGIKVKDIRTLSVQKSATVAAPSSSTHTSSTANTSTTASSAVRMLHHHQNMEWNSKYEKI